MDHDEIIKKFKLIVINIETEESWILSSDRQVSKFLNDTYNLDISHMYIRRHLQDEKYILKESILIKNLW
jgi:hypothetical protein